MSATTSPTSNNPLNAQEPTIQADTIIALNSIKENLNKIPDTSLALDILEDLESVKAQIAAQALITANAEAELKRIQKINNDLLLRATKQNSIEVPKSTVDYNGIDAVQSVIDRI